MNLIINKILNKNNIRKLILKDFKLSLSFCLFGTLLLGEIYRPYKAIADKNRNIPPQEYIKNLPDSNFYILGPGDRLSIEVKEDDTPDLNKSFEINGEGVAFLERLKRIYVEGLTMAEIISHSISGLPRRRWHRS